MPYHYWKMHFFRRTLPLLALLAPLEAPAASEHTKREWYVVESEGKPQAYYSEFLVRDAKKKSLVTVQEWKYLDQAPGGSTLRTVTLDDDLLTPVSVDATTRSKDGKKEHKLEITMKKAGKFKDLEYRFRRLAPVPSLEKKQHVMPKEPLFFSSLPRFLARLQPGLVTATALMEDAESAEMKIRLLRLNRMAETKEMHGRSCIRSVVDMNGAIGDMWVTAEGRLCAFLLPSTNTRIFLATEADLRKADPKRKKF